MAILGCFLFYFSVQSRMIFALKLSASPSIVIVFANFDYLACVLFDPELRTFFAPFRGSLILYQTFSDKFRWRKILFVSIVAKILRRNWPVLPKVYKIFNPRAWLAALVSGLADTSRDFLLVWRWSRRNSLKVNSLWRLYSLVMLKPIDDFDMALCLGFQGT